MSESGQTVLVLGAGFTKAFFPTAPLLKGNWGHVERNLDPGLTSSLREIIWQAQENEAGSYPIKDMHGSRQHAVAGPKTDIERLMTRLDSGMPYDSADHRAEMRLALFRLTSLVKRRIEDVRTSSGANNHELEHFARRCIEKRVTCLTFNYDDFLDEAFFAGARYGKVYAPGDLYWHPDDGYGFACSPAFKLVSPASDLEGPGSSMLMLKLHGSINWRIRRGHHPPYAVEDIVHKEPWCLFTRPDRKIDDSMVNLHLEPAPFIVPPVLIKTDLNRQPILNIVWSLAREAIARAEKIIFVGYSFPVTDLFSTFLFQESIRRDKAANIRVVNKADTEEEQKNVMDAYRSCFPALKKDQFDFRCASAWAREF